MHENGARMSTSCGSQSRAKRARLNSTKIGHVLKKFGNLIRFYMHAFLIAICHPISALRGREAKNEYSSWYHRCECVITYCDFASIRSVSRTPNNMRNSTREMEFSSYFCTGRFDAEKTLYPLNHNTYCSEKGFARNSSIFIFIKFKYLFMFSFIRMGWERSAERYHRTYHSSALMLWTENKIKSVNTRAKQSERLMQVWVGKDRRCRDIKC